MRLYLVRRTCRDDLTAVNTCTGSDIDDIIGRLHSFLVVLDDDKAVACVTQTPQGCDKFGVIALMQANTRLVEDIQHAHKRRAYLRGKAYALCLTARQSTCLTRERKVFKSDALQKSESGFYLLDYLPRNSHFGFGKGKAIYKFERLRHRHSAEIVNVYAADSNRERHRIKALTVTFGARRVLDKFLVIFVL